MPYYLRYRNLDMDIPMLSDRAIPSNFDNSDQVSASFLRKWDLPSLEILSLHATNTGDQGAVESQNGVVNGS